MLGPKEDVWGLGKGIQFWPQKTDCWDRWILLNLKAKDFE